MRNRRPGRPLLGDEPLDDKITVLVTKSLRTRLNAVAGGRVSDYVRKLLERALYPKRSHNQGRNRSTGRRRRRLSRY